MHPTRSLFGAVKLVPISWLRLAPHTIRKKKKRSEMVFQLTVRPNLRFSCGEYHTTTMV